MQVTSASTDIKDIFFVLQWAGKCSCYKCLPEKDLFDVEYWELEQAKVRKGPAAKDFDGKIVAVRYE